jgi:hypothetical protein
MENPDIYLGPNYKSVINFYELFTEGRISYTESYYLSLVKNMDYSSRLSSTALEVIPKNIADNLQYYNAAFELIAMHLLLERGETLKYLPLLSYR